MLRVRTCLLVLVAALLVLPGAASAAPVQEWWTADAETCGGYNSAERGSGQMDSLGRLYIPCSRSQRADGSFAHDNYIAVMNAAGQQVDRIALDFTPGNADGSTERASDVAPSPDGSFLYVIHYASYTTYRFDRQADGSYRARSQAEWRLAPYPNAAGGGSNRPLGQFLATDANGAIYFSSGLWACNIECTSDAVVKYDANGGYVTRFGQKVGGSRVLGHSAGSFGGLAVTHDGRRVFVADVNNSRVQRFVLQGNGSYAADLEFGANTNDEAGCFQVDVLAAPYDLAMTARGELMVQSATCLSHAGFYNAMPAWTINIQRYAQDGTPRGSILATSKRTCTDDGGTAEDERNFCRVHGIAADRGGNLHMAQGMVVLRPSATWTDAGADVTGGGPLGGASNPDVTAPVITSLTATPTTTTGTAVTLAVAATDAVGISGLRLREDGIVQGGWRPYATSVAHTITDRLGAHELVIEVRDHVGNVSAARAVTITRTTQPVQPAPTEPTSPTQPTQPTQPAQPTNPIQPVQPTNPTAPGGGTVEGGGGVTGPRPSIVKLSMPVQVFRGSRIAISVRATGAQKVTHVRFSTTGTRWTGWRAVRSGMPVALPSGLGWKGVFVQVRDAAGTPSIAWFQPVLVGPRGVQWRKGSRGADSIRTGRGAQHVDVSSFDRVVDRVSCGAGFDTVLAQPEDVVARDCERVVRVTIPRG